MQLNPTEQDRLLVFATAQLAQLARSLARYKEKEACELASRFVDGERGCRGFAARGDRHHVLPRARRARQAGRVERHEHYAGRELAHLGTFRRWDEWA